MAGVPFLGRLFLREYFALVGSFILIGLEIVVRVITLALPERILLFFYERSRRLFNYLSSPQGKKSRAKKRSVVNPIAQASDFVDLCELAGYTAEEHVVQTEDGYLLGVHRLAWRRGEEDRRINAGQGSIQKKVVYMHHGLMMNSEAWVCLTEEERCLPFRLVERGFDVWLGNNRGNKYSKKSTRYSPTSIAFWNFSIDQFAFHDIPDTISYVLSTTGKSSLAYIGFSQGTAQAFATLSIHPTLNEKVDVFIALAPAMSPPGLANGIVASLVKTSPEILYLAFGRRSILSSATMWQALLYPPIFTRAIDISLSFLFGWHTRNITPHQKLAAYPHLFSFSSTKSVVHWFQIIRNGTFQMFDDEVQSPLSVSDGSRYYKVAKFPTRNIRTPVVLVYGGSDSLVDINIMLKELPKHTVAKEIPKYEHLDFLWASDIDKLVFPHVFEALDQHSKSFSIGAEGQKQLTSYAHNEDEILIPRRPSIHQPQITNAWLANGTDSSSTTTPPPVENSPSPSSSLTKLRSPPSRPLAFSSPSYYQPLPRTTSSSNLNHLNHLASYALPAPPPLSNLLLVNSLPTPPATDATSQLPEPDFFHPLTFPTPAVETPSPTQAPTDPPNEKPQSPSHSRPQTPTILPPTPPQSAFATAAATAHKPPHSPLIPYKRRRHSPSRYSSSSVSDTERERVSWANREPRVGRRGIEIPMGRAVVGGSVDVEGGSGSGGERK